MKLVRKTIDILEVFLNGEKEISVTDLAEITGHNVSTVHGILSELSKSGYVQQLEKRGKYSLGLRFLSFRGSANKIVASIDIIQPLLQELCDQVNETTNIAINSGNHTVNIAIVEGKNVLRVIPVETQPAPLYSTGIGKIFLSARTNEELDKYLESQQLIAYTSKTITDKNKLKRQIEKIRREGFATDNEEYTDGVRNIAAPIRDYDGKIAAAIGIVGPTLRLSKQRIKELTPLVQTYAKKISELISSRKINSG